jgi:hypothetical protein
MATINETINDVSDLKQVLEEADDNAVVFLNPNKTYKCNSNTTISIHASNVRIIGCDAQFAEGENPQGSRAKIEGDGKLTFSDCTGLQIRGFIFRVRFVMNRCQDCKVEYSDLKYDAPGKNHVFYLKDSARNHIYNCKFHDKDNEGAFLIIRIEKEEEEEGDNGATDIVTSDNVVERCEFCDHRFDNDGGESIVIGHSNQANDDLHTEISNCWFHDLDADPETISIKSRGNNIHNCLHEKNDSSFTVRHGYDNRIEQCIFRGRGGIRLYGKDNHVVGNYFSNNSVNDRLPITVGNGNESSDGSYALVTNNHITGNTFENCPTICVLWGKNPTGGGPDKPVDNHFLDNTIIVDEDISGCKVLKRADVDDVTDNEFANNIIYAGGKEVSEERKKEIIGDLPHSYEIVDDRPQAVEPIIELPYQWPQQE